MYLECTCGHPRPSDRHAEEQIMRNELLNQWINYVYGAERKDGAAFTKPAWDKGHTADARDPFMPEYIGG